MLVKDYINDLFEIPESKFKNKSLDLMAKYQLRFKKNELKLYILKYDLELGEVTLKEYPILDYDIYHFMLRVIPVYFGFKSKCFLSNKLNYIDLSNNPRNIILAGSDLKLLSLKMHLLVSESYRKLSDNWSNEYKKYSNLHRKISANITNALNV